MDALVELERVTTEVSAALEGAVTMRLSIGS